MSLLASLVRRDTMDEKLFKELDANLKEAVKVAKGASAPKSVYVVLTPAEIHVTSRVCADISAERRYHQRVGARQT